MPVIENEPHAITVRAGDAPYGCSNKTRKAGFYMMARSYLPTGEFFMELKYIANTMTRWCHHDKSLTDKRCAECKQRGIGDAHAAKYRQQAG